LLQAKAAYECAHARLQTNYNDDAEKEAYRLAAAKVQSRVVDCR
jgi:hypothetical protein